MDPLRGLEYTSATPFSDLLAGYFHREGLPQENAQTLITRSMGFLRYEQGLANEVAAIEKLTIEDIQGFNLPAGVKQLCVAIINQGIFTALIRVVFYLYTVLILIFWTRRT